MYRCELCITFMLERNKTKHNQTKKHKYHSNLILNRYDTKNVGVIKLKGVLNPYLTAHTRKFNFFIVSIYDGEHPLNQKIIVSNYVTFNIQSEH